MLKRFEKIKVVKAIFWGARREKSVLLSWEEYSYPFYGMCMCFVERIILSILWHLEL